MKALVTGGAGFIGSNLVDRLISEGHEVVTIDDLSGGKQENINPQAEFIYDSILNYSKLLNISQGVDVIFHVAALPRVVFSVEHPKEAHDANVNGTFNVLLAAREKYVKKVIFSSSSSVYGDQPKLPLIETMVPNPGSPYALHKLIGEHYCRLFSEFYGIETISLRYFNVYGPKQDPAGAYANLIPAHIALVLQGKRPIIYGDGSKTRDFAFVDDIVEANIIATEFKLKGEVVNIGSGISYSVNQIADAIIENIDRKIKPIYKENRPGEPQDTLADVTKAKKILGWASKTKFKEGMSKEIEYFRNLYKNKKRG